MRKQMPSSKGYGYPGPYAKLRRVVSWDMATAILLFRVCFYFDPKRPRTRLARFEKEWIAMSRDQWANEAGLSRAEMKDRALPRLRKYDFIDIKQMALKNGGPKLLWISLNVEMLTTDLGADDIHDFLRGPPRGPGYERPGEEYPYKPRKPKKMPKALAVPSSETPPLPHAHEGKKLTIGGKGKIGWI